MGNSAKSGAQASFSFSPSSSIGDAEKYLSQFVDSSRFGALGVSYEGIGLDSVNEINRTIGSFYAEYDVEKFGGIKAPKGNTTEGKRISNATAAYSSVRRSFYLNRNSLKDVKTAEKNLLHEQEVVKKYLKNPENYNTGKISPTVMGILQRAKTSGRSTVPKTVSDAINHELGHMIENKVQRHPLWEKAQSGMKTFADKISGYAGTNASEYIAESFASYRKGEGLIDPSMESIFKSLKRR